MNGIRLIKAESRRSLDCRRRFDQRTLMSESSFSLRSTVVDTTFHSMEEVNELSRASGREGEYRQLSKGRITDRWRRLSLGEFILSSHSMDKRIHGHLSPCRGYVAMAVMPPPHSMLVNGREFGSGQVLVLDANSQRDFVSPEEGTACYTLIVPESVMVASRQALFPRMRMNRGMTDILQCPSSGWSTLHGEVAGLLRNGRVSQEDFSHLLSRFLGLMAGEPERRQEEVSIGNRSTAHVARRAQEYIEDHYPQTMRLEDLCRYTGVSLRTLQRCFSRYFQASPVEYLRARRLHAARQALLSAKPSQHNVFQIALENGFTHHGRFSVYYREHFGELPKETLARDK